MSFYAWVLSLGIMFTHGAFFLLDPFGGDPFKESDPFRGSATDDFFKKQTKNDPFTSDPFMKNPSLPSKVSGVGRCLGEPHTCSMCVRVALPEGLLPFVECTWCLRVWALVPVLWELVSQADCIPAE